MGIRHPTGVGTAAARCSSSCALSWCAVPLASLPGAACSQGSVYLKPLLLLQTPGSVCQSLQLGNIIFGYVSLLQHRKYSTIKTNRKK